MGRKSTFSQLPEEVSDYFHSLLANGRYTQVQIVGFLNALLKDLGEEPVITRDIVQKQAKNYNERLAVTGERLRRERELSEKLIKEIGCKPSTEQSQVMSVLLQSMITRLAMDMDDQEESPSVKDIKNLAHAHKIVTDSNKTIELLIAKARDEAAKEALEAMRQQGVDEEKITRIERVIVRPETKVSHD